MKARIAIPFALIALFAPLALWTDPLSGRRHGGPASAPTAHGTSRPAPAARTVTTPSPTLPQHGPDSTAPANMPPSDAALDLVIVTARENQPMEDRLKDLGMIEEEVERGGAKSPLVKRLLALVRDRAAPLRLRGLCLLTLSSARDEILPEIYKVTEPPEEEWMRLFAAFTLTIKPISEDYGDGEYGPVEREDFWRGVMRSSAFGDILAPGFSARIMKEEKEGTLPDETNRGGYTFASRYSQTLDDPTLRAQAWQTILEGHELPVRREFLDSMNMRPDDGTNLERLISDRTQPRTLRCSSIFQVARCPAGSTLAILANILCDPTEEKVVRDNAASTLGTLRHLDRSILVPMLTSQIEKAFGDKEGDTAGLLVQTLLSTESVTGEQFVTEHLLRSTDREARLRAISALARRAESPQLESARKTALGEQLLREQDDSARLAICRSYLAHFESPTGASSGSPPPDVLAALQSELDRSSKGDNTIARSIAASLLRQISRLKPAGADVPGNADGK